MSADDVLGCGAQQHRLLDATVLLLSTLTAGTEIVIAISSLTRAIVAIVMEMLTVLVTRIVLPTMAEGNN